MQYCNQNQNSKWTSSQDLQSGSQFVQYASQTQQSLNTNGIHQFNVSNSRVQQSQSSNDSHSQPDLSGKKTNQDIAGVVSSDRTAIIKNCSLLVSLLRDGIVPDINQALGIRTRASISNINITPFQQVGSVEQQQCSIPSSVPQQGYNHSSNKEVEAKTKSASLAGAALAPHQQWVYPNTASPFPSSAYVQNFNPNGTQGYFTSHLVRLNHQSFSNCDVMQSSVNTQSMYIPTTDLKTIHQNGNLRARQVNLENVNNGLNYYPPPYSISHSSNLPRISNQIVPSSATFRNKNYNRNGIQLSPNPPKRPQSVTPGTDLSLPPQTPLPNNASTGSARVECGWGQAVLVSHSNNNMVQEGNPVISSSEGSLHLQDPECVSSKATQKHELITKIRHWLEEMPETLTQKPSSQVMPSHANTRAVAVVQPLSQEGENISTNKTSKDSLINPDKGCVLRVNNCCEHQRLDVGLDTEHSIAKEPNKAMPPKRTVMLNSGLEKQESVVRKRKSPPCISKEPRSGKRKNATPSPAPNDITSFPTTTWTAADLKLLIQETERSQVIPENVPSDLPGKLQRMYEDVIHSKVYHGPTFGWRKTFIKEVKHFCEQHVSPDTVVLSQVKETFKEKLQHYCILEDEPYLEPPYKSLWLNVSEKLDDIDNEFGFPWALRRHFYVDESDSQKDEEKIEEDHCKPAMNEVPGKVLSVSEVVNPAVKDQTSLQPPLTPTNALNDSGDPNYSFQIQVLSPEKAKALYEEVQKEDSSTSDQKEIVKKDHMKTDTPSCTDATSPKPDIKILSVSSINQMCCLGKFMEINSGLNTPSVKCLCKEKEEDCKSTGKTVASDPKNQNVVEDDCEIITLSEELPSKFYQIIDLTDDDKLDPATNQEPSMDHCMPIDSLSDFDITSSTEEDEPSNECSSLEEIPNFVIKLSESEEESATEEATSLETVPTTSSDDCTKQAEPLKLSSPTATILLQTQEDDNECGQTSSFSEEEMRASVKIKNQRDMGPKTSSETVIGSCFKNLKQKMKSKSLCTVFPSVKESQALTSEEKSVKLVLFGSANQGRKASPVNKMNHHSSSTMMSSIVPHPPRVLSLNIESSQKNFMQAAFSGKLSVKQLIYEKWSKSIPSCYRNKVKRQKRDEKGKVSQGRKRTRFLPNTVGVKGTKRRRYRVSLEQNAHLEQRNTENEVEDSLPLNKNIILKFSTLPSTFSFTDGLSAEKEDTNQVSDQSETVNNDSNYNQSPGDVVKTIKSKGLWSSSLDQQSEPPKTSKNSHLFEEYQKKYREKTRP